MDIFPEVELYIIWNSFLQVRVISYLGSPHHYHHNANKEHDEKKRSWLQTTTHMAQFCLSKCVEATPCHSDGEFFEVWLLWHHSFLPIFSKPITQLPRALSNVKSFCCRYFSDISSHKDFFTMLQGQMKLCSSYEELVQLCTSAKEGIPWLEMANFCNVHLDRDAEDLVSRAYIPEDCQVALPFAIKASPNGSCFAHAASRLTFGHEFNHVEMHCQIVVEGVLNREKYLDPVYMAQGIQNFHYKSTVPELYATLGGVYDSTNSKEDTGLIYNRDIFNFHLKGVEAGQFQFCQLVNVLNVPLMSIYLIMPAHEQLREGHLQQRKAYNQVIALYSIPWGDHLADHIARGIMWTMATHGLSTPNHFITMVP